MDTSPVSLRTKETKKGDDLQIRLDFLVTSLSIGESPVPVPTDSRDLNGGIAFLEFDGFAGFDGGGKFVDGGEHQEQAYGTQDTAVYHSYRRAEETAYQERHAKDKSCNKY